MLTGIVNHFECNFIDQEIESYQKEEKIQRTYEVTRASIFRDQKSQMFGNSRSRNVKACMISCILKFTSNSRTLVYKSLLTDRRVKYYSIQLETNTASNIIVWKVKFCDVHMRILYFYFNHPLVYFKFVCNVCK